jgi:hypothetical protein
MGLSRRKPDAGDKVGTKGRPRIILQGLEQSWAEGDRFLGGA